MSTDPHALHRRYELTDTEHPKQRGQRFADLDRARREHAHAHPRARFRIVDRATGADVTDPTPAELDPEPVPPFYVGFHADPTETNQEGDRQP